MRDAQNNLSLVEPKLKKEQLDKEDEARGYKRMSFTDFQLDAKTMRTGKRLSINGFYEVNGHLQSLTEKPSPGANAKRVQIASTFRGCT